MKRAIKYIAILLLPLLQAFECQEKPPVYDKYWVVKNDTNAMVYILQGFVYMTDIQDIVVMGGDMVRPISSQETVVLLELPTNCYGGDDFSAYINYTCDYSKREELNDLSFWVAVSPDGEAVKRWRYGDREQDLRNFFNESSWEYEYDAATGHRTWTFHILPEDLEESE